MAAAVNAANNVENGAASSADTSGEDAESGAESDVVVATECKTQLATATFHSTALWFVCLCLATYSVGMTCALVQLRRKMTDGGNQKFQAVGGSRPGSLSPGPNARRGPATSVTALQELDVHRRDMHSREVC
jgi:hypothetical protein